LDEAKITTQIQEKEATLAFEQDELARYEKMLKDDAVPLSEAEKERTVIKELQASLSQLDVMLKEVQERKARLEIIAPFDGSVVAKHAEVGEYVSVGSQIVDIVSAGRIDARIMVPEESLPLLEEGKQLDLVVDALGLEMRGKVFSINAQGSVGSRTFPVRVELDDRNGELLPGMGVSVFVPVMRESTELLVPRDAVLTKPDGSTIWIVKRVDDDNAGQQEHQATLVVVPLPVRVLSHTRDAYAISPERKGDKELIVPGVKVVTEGLERLIPGAAVRIDPDTSPLAPVPGMYRTGQQVVERPE
jgi:RND family efflux transporter MFP subunit